MKSNLLFQSAPLRAALVCAALVAALVAPAAALSPGDATAAPSAPDSTSLDVRAFRLLNGDAVNPVFDKVMPFATDFDRWRIAVILIWCALVIFGRTRGRWAALMLIPIIAASDQLSASVMKPIFERMRPCEVIGNVHLWLGAEGWITTPAEVARSYKNSFSFPSSHATNITASMLFLGLVYRRWLAPLLAVALLVSFSRIYTGVHWPSDVLTGMLIGAAIAAIAYYLFKRFSPADRHEAACGRDAAPAPISKEPPPAR
ncbi:MAG: phosphatase PAP2 family protein [Candidatus Krumholzibacteria bacterium]|nr:phosphatase PAP2 family protein [Candidatus Krumholzibacteria bacterium]